MEIWGVNFWMLFEIFLLVTILFIVWGLKLMKRKKEDGPAVFALVSSAFGALEGIIYLVVTYAFLDSPPPRLSTTIADTSPGFMIWTMFLGFSFLALITTQFLGEEKDSPNNANIKLKKIKKEQEEKMKEITTK